MTTEKDPNGINAHQPGSKLDAGKPIAGEIVTSFSHALNAMIEVATFGAGKYTRRGFLQVPNAEERYRDALMRHLLKYGMGEEVDSDSGLPHLSHALWNMAAMLEVHLRGVKALQEQLKFETETNLKVKDFL